MADEKKRRPGEIEVDPQSQHSTEILEAIQKSDSPEPKFGSGIFSTRMSLVLLVKSSDHRFVFEMAKVQQLLLGRYDAATNTTPEVDLTPFDGVKQGVSRRHAALKRNAGVLNVVDLGGPNGTYLNDQRLVAGQNRVVRDGDEIRLGNLALTVHFEKVANAPE